LQPRRGHAGQNSGLRSEIGSAGEQMRECYRLPVDTSGSRLLDGLHISMSRDFPRVNLGPFGSNNRYMISGILIALLLLDCRQTVRSHRSVLPRSPFMDSFLMSYGAL